MWPSPRAVCGSKPPRLGPRPRLSMSQWESVPIWGHLSSAVSPHVVWRRSVSERGQHSSPSSPDAPTCVQPCGASRPDRRGVGHCCRRFLILAIGFFLAPYLAVIMQSCYGFHSLPRPARCSIGSAGLAVLLFPSFISSCLFCVSLVAWRSMSKVEARPTSFVV